MAFGVQVFDGAGALTWDSSAAPGGVVADSREIPSGWSGSFTYPDFAGFVAQLVNVCDTRPATITTDMALGYPRVNVTSAAIVGRRFVLAVA